MNPTRQTEITASREEGEEETETSGEGWFRFKFKFWLVDISVTEEERKEGKNSVLRGETGSPHVDRHKVKFVLFKKDKTFKNSSLLERVHLRSRFNPN